jgi:hypothetical protein
MQRQSFSPSLIPRVRSDHFITHSSKIVQIECDDDYDQPLSYNEVEINSISSDDSVEVSDFVATLGKRTCSQT